MNRYAVRPNLKRCGVLTIHRMNNGIVDYSHAYNHTNEVIYLQDAKPHVLSRACRIFSNQSVKFPCASITGVISSEPDVEWESVFYDPRIDPVRFLLCDGSEWTGSRFAKLYHTKAWIGK